MKNSFGFIRWIALVLAVILVFMTPAALAAGSGTADQVSWTLDDDGNLVITGTGPIPSYKFSKNEEIRTVEIREGVTEIRSNVFYRCANLEKITVAGSVTSIGESAFMECKKLGCITIPESVTEIGDYAFSAFNGKIIFLGDAPVISENAFSMGNVIAVYPHDRSGWDEAVKKNYGAEKYMRWQADNAPDEETEDPLPKDPTEPLVQEKSYNAAAHEYVERGRIQTVTGSYLIPEEDGGVTRVEFFGDKGICVEQYTKDMTLIWKKTLRAELEMWGGFYAGSKWNYLVFGQINQDGENDREVLRVVRYSKNWNRIDSASLYGQEIKVPFYGGTLSMVEGGKYLYLHGGCLHFTGHQANMSFKLHIPTMTFTEYTQAAPEGSINGAIFEVPGYASHSFNQYIYVDGDDAIMVDHGDGNPRAVVIAREKNDTERPGLSPAERVELVRIGGQEGNNYTGLTVGGSQPSDTRYIVTGKSIDQGKFGETVRNNIYVVTASKEDFTDASVTFRWQTNYPEDSTVILSNPFLVRITGKKLLLLWMEQLSQEDPNALLYYVFLDEDGEASSRVYSTVGYLSDVQPVVNGNSVEWYVTAKGGPVFYSLDLDNPEILRRGPDVIYLGKNGWVKNEEGRWLYGDVNGCAAKGVQQIGAQFYFFDEQGIMQTGWIRQDGKWYYAYEEGRMATNGVYIIDNESYCFDENGVMGVGFVKTSSGWRYCDENGRLQTGWIQNNGNWYFLSSFFGIMQTGWVMVDGVWYFFNSDGAMATGWTFDGADWYYMKSSGTMATGWVKDSGKWYYLNDNGTLRTGWMQDGKDWYFLTPDGAMATGWQKDGGSWYYFNSSGRMETGWQRIGGKWYYFRDGAMVTGWFEDKEAEKKLPAGEKKEMWYWFDESGTMATGWKEIKGSWEMFDDSGLWLYTWQEN